MQLSNAKIINKQVTRSDLLVYQIPKKERRKKNNVGNSLTIILEEAYI